MAKIGRRDVQDELCKEAVDWLNGDHGGAWEYLDPDAKERAALWAKHRKEIVAAWVAERPGTRPARWWEHDAPEPRLRLGGVGTPAHDVLAKVPAFSFGVPATFVTAFLVRFYAASEEAGDCFTGVAIDEPIPRYTKARRPIWTASACFSKASAPV